MSKNRGQSPARRFKRQRIGLTSEKARKNVKFLQNVDNSFKIKNSYGARY
jgi:hypothetical protein